MHGHQAFKVGESLHGERRVVQACGLCATLEEDSEYSCLNLRFRLH